MTGTLYLVATPIGNLEDVTLRALRVLKEVDLIACEDTRHTRKLLAAYQIAKPTTSYHEHNERERTTELIERLLAGANIALVSDAGTPLVSDPGFRLVREAIARGVPVVPLPGPSAFVTALVASGVAAAEFMFVGFLPARSGARRTRLSELVSYNVTLVIYESPHRLKETLKDALNILGDRKVVVARELTKMHEQFLRGTLSEIAAGFDENSVRGEIVLIIAPAQSDSATGTQTARSMTEDVDEIIEREGLDPKAALKRVARARGLTKSDAYRQLVAERAARGLGKKE
jgi:16S rRNA (cytidine1402-2'-O)-methyltransferase